MDRFSIAIWQETPRSINFAKEAGFNVYLNEQKLLQCDFYNSLIAKKSNDLIGFIDGSILVSSDIIPKLQEKFKALPCTVGAVYCDQNNKLFPCFQPNYGINPYLFINGAITTELFEYNTDMGIFELAIKKILTACPILHIAEPLLTQVSNDS